MIQVVCDGCGRVCSQNRYETLTVETTERGKETKHFCTDPDGGTVGCFRKVYAMLSHAKDFQASDVQLEMIIEEARGALSNEAGSLLSVIESIRLMREHG